MSPLIFPVLSFLEKGVFLGSDLKWESPPGCVTFDGNCLAIQALSSNTTREVDINGDGQIDYEEFKQMMLKVNDK